MAFPSVSDIVTTSIEARSKTIADNVTKNNAILVRLGAKDKIKEVDGGSSILEELSYAENGNGSWYSGYDLLPVAAQDVISAAQYTFRQLAVPVVVSGLEKLQNAGREKIIDLVEKRLDVAESTMSNRLSEGLYSDGTGYGGKQLQGLASAIVLSPLTGTYGGIDRSLWSFWRNAVNASGGLTAANIFAQLTALWVKLVRGKDHPDLIMADNGVFTTYLAALQPLMRFSDPKMAEMGFQTVKFMGADVVLDGGLGGFAPTNTAYFLNTNYIRLRPHKDRNMVPIDPESRAATNQDAEVTMLGWAGNLTTSNLSLQGYFS